MKKLEYAIVDIETTGGNARGSRITEIAIIVHDGKKVIERFETLVNPKKEIPLPIFALTGINNEMVKNAPTFDDISEKVYELLSERIFVAHNVNFDYSFVRHQLEEAGFKWIARKLCTVRAARKIKPGLASYSLGRLCNSLGIKLENRHRAGGDADATAILFARLLEWDEEKVIEQMLKKTAQDQRLPPNLSPDDYNNLPEKIGVYYFYNEFHKVIYVGKAINIKKRVTTHFSGHNVNAQRQNFLRDIHSISFEVCATELMALILECTEIKKLWPAYNRALKKYEPKYGLYQYEARNGYKYLAIGKVTKFQLNLEHFSSLHEGVNLLQSLSHQFEIDYRFCKYDNTVTKGNLFEVELMDLPEVENHNEKVDNAIEYLKNSKQSFGIIDKGRTEEERSCIWVENGHFYGMGYLSCDEAITESSQYKENLTLFKSNQYIMQLIFKYVEKNPRKIIRN
ncbi:exonuclease domain-containing protein [Flavobacterium sp.]|uniref:exonuclease domain-containing protein n=1 Tax=Flavobacterium sp. TaxID=239 RepID=UPI003C3F6D9D